MSVTPNCGHADHRCGLVWPTVTESTRPAASGKNRTMSQRHVSGRSCTMTGMTNIRPIAEVIAPAVCLMIAPRPNAISATTVTNSAVPMIAVSTVPGEITMVPLNVTLPAGPFWTAFAGIVTEWNSEALTPEPDMAAWPTKNAMNEVTSETTRVTVLNTSSFAAYTVPRRGIAVSEVRIIPVEYSDVIVSAPSTAMISWPSSKKPPSEACVASIPALFAGLLWRLFAIAKPAMAAKPTLTMTIAAIVQYVERTERSLVNSEPIAPASPARPDAVGGQFHERLLEGGPKRAQFVYPNALLEGDVADRVVSQPAYQQRAIAAG